MSHAPLRVHAIILNFRDAPRTTACVASLAGQVESISVIDNSASVDEAAVLKSALARWTETGWVQIHVPAGNLGFAAGVNHALTKPDGAAADAILVINNDAVAEPGMVTEMSDTLRLHAGNAVVAARARQGSAPSSLWYHRILGVLLSRPLPGTFLYLSGACLLLPRHLAGERLFDPDFFMYGEDVALSWRMQRGGIAMVCADAATFHHPGSAASKRGSLFYEYHIVRGHILLATKLRRNACDQLLLYAGRAITLPLRAGIRSVRSRSFAPLAALAMAVRRRPPPLP